MAVERTGLPPCTVLRLEPLNGLAAQSIPALTSLTSVSLYSAADGKPVHSYATLITRAIRSADDDKRLTLAQIYKWITDTFPYYRTAGNGWKVSLVFFSSTAWDLYRAQHARACARLTLYFAKS